MPTVLITAFEPYGSWKENSSWLAMVELVRRLPDAPRVTTRRYPVDFSRLRQCLEKDMEANHDVALHLGQSPGAGRIEFESVAINVGQEAGDEADVGFPLCEDGPVAYRSDLPLSSWVQQLGRAGVPAGISYHAGVSLSNAVFYWSCRLADTMGLKTRSTLLHLPLDVTQVTGQSDNLASLPAGTSARAVRLILDELTTCDDV